MPIPRATYAAVKPGHLRRPTRDVPSVREQVQNVIDRDFGHLTHGYVLTSHASQGDTVDKVFAGISSESLAATNQRTAYVALTRGKEQVLVFTDDRKELLKAMERPDDPLSATELSESGRKPSNLMDRLKTLAFMRGVTEPERESTHDRGLDHTG